MTEYMASADEEEWHEYARYPTREEAVQHAPEDLDLEIGATFWTGEIVPFVPKIDAHCALERLGEDAADDNDSDAASDWLSPMPPKADVESLQALLDLALRMWFTAYPQHAPTFCGIEHAKEHTFEDAVDEAAISVLKAIPDRPAEDGAP